MFLVPSEVPPSGGISASLRNSPQNNLYFYMCLERSRHPAGSPSRFGGTPRIFSFIDLRPHDFEPACRQAGRARLLVCLERESNPHGLTSTRF